MIEAIVQEFSYKFSASVVSEITPFNIGGDIDIFAKDSQRSAIINFFQSKNFVVFGELKMTFYAGLFSDGDLYVINVVFPSAHEYHLLRFYPSVSFKPIFFKDIQNDYDLERFIRYSLQLRNHKPRFIEFVSQNFHNYGHYLSDTTYFSKPVFKKNLKKEYLIKAMKRNKISLFRILGLSKLLKLYSIVLLIHLKQFGKGEVVAFVGADGAGKSTAIEKTWHVMGVHKMYMGDVNFKLQPFYNWLLSQHIVVARSTYLFMYIENWFRYVWIWLRTLKGDTVYTDRWPGLNQHLRSDGNKMKIHDWLYKFYPTADRYVFLSGEPVLVHNRKPELTIDEIYTLQNNLRLRLKRQSYIEVNESSLDKALYQTLKFLTSK